MFKIPWIIIGAMMTALSLEVILIPNGLIDGGITGISMMLSEKYGFSLSLLLFILNIPFILIGFKHLGKRFTFLATLGIVSLTVSTAIFERSSPFVEGNFILLILIGAVALAVQAVRGYTLWETWIFYCVGYILFDLAYFARPKRLKENRVKSKSLKEFIISFGGDATVLPFFYILMVVLLVFGYMNFR